MGMSGAFCDDGGSHEQRRWLDGGVDGLLGTWLRAAAAPYCCAPRCWCSGVHTAKEGAGAPGLLVSLLRWWTAGRAKGRGQVLVRKDEGLCGQGELGLLLDRPWVVAGGLEKGGLGLVRQGRRQGGLGAAVLLCHGSNQKGNPGWSSAWCC